MIMETRNQSCYPDSPHPGNGPSERSESGYPQTGGKLHQVDRLLHAVYKHSSDVIYTLDCNFRVTSVSNSVERHLGYRAEELIGRPFNEINVLAPESLEAAIKNTLQALSGVTAPAAEYVFIRKDGSRVIGEVSGSPLVEDGKIVGLITVARNITDRKRAEEERQSLEERLRRAEKMEAIGQMAGGVAHDLNNVLGILSGYTELLLLEIPEGHRSRGYAEKILQSTEKGASIIQDLLTLTRRGVTASDVINLNSVVSGFLKTPVFEKIKTIIPV
jgi:PAS domain S-box-containing protein